MRWSFLLHLCSIGLEVKDRIADMAQYEVTSDHYQEPGRHISPKICTFRRPLQGVSKSRGWTHFGCRQLCSFFSDLASNRIILSSMDEFRTTKFHSWPHSRKTPGKTRPSGTTGRIWARLPCVKGQHSLRMQDTGGLCCHSFRVCSDLFSRDTDELFW